MKNDLIICELKINQQHTSYAYSSLLTLRRALLDAKEHNRPVTIENMLEKMDYAIHELSIVIEGRQD